MADYKCKKIIIADGQGGASRTIELGGDIDSGNITWKHGSETETPTLEDRANHLWEIWQPGRKVQYTGSSSNLNLIATDTLSCTAILSDDYCNYNERIIGSNQTLVLGKNCAAIGKENVVGDTDYTGEDLVGPNNCMVIGENNNIFNRNIRNSLICGKGLQLDTTMPNNSDSLCVLGRYNTIDGDRYIDKLANNTLVLIGKGTDDNNRKNVLNLNSFNLFLDLNYVQIENCAQGLSISEEDFSTPDHYTTWIKPGQLVIQKALENDELIMTKIHYDKITTGTIIAKSIDFDLSMADGKAPNFMTIEGRCGAGDLDGYIRCFVSGDYTVTDGTKFQIRPITANTYYPIGVLTDFANHKDSNNNSANINDRPKVVVSGFCWVRMNIGPTYYTVGSFCQIDVESQNGGMTLYRQDSSDSPTFNRYWRIIGKKTDQGENLALIQLDQFFCK